MLLLFDPDAGIALVSGHPVVSGVYCGAADPSFGGAERLLTGIVVCDELDPWRIRHRRDQCVRGQVGGG